MSPIDLRRAACSVATWMATRCTELKAADTWPISSFEVTGPVRDHVQVARVLGAVQPVDQAGQPLVGDLVGAAGQVRSGPTIDLAIHNESRP